MIVVKDAMVLIHLAKLSLLRTSCEALGEIVIPKKIEKETVERGKQKNHPDAILIEELIENNTIEVNKVKNKKLIKRAKDFNIQGGEAEAVALYWEKNADYLATDDDNVRTKRKLLDLDLISTISILINLFKDEEIGRNKLEESLKMLNEIGWFSTAVLDRAKMEVGLI